MSGDRAIEVSGAELRITNPDKVLFPSCGITKAEMVGYYARIAGVMLRYVGGRPLVLERFPDGIGEGGFYQKNASGHFPDRIERVRVASSDGGSTLYPVVHDELGLAYLAGQGTVVFHTLLSRADEPRTPVEVIFDLDPATEQDTDLVRAAAGEIRDVLEELDLAPRVKTSGSKGLHVVIDVTDEDADFELTGEFSRRVANEVVGRGPFTLEHRRARRHGRLFLDVLRNSPSAHAVAPYSLRALPDAPVAAPLDWGEALSADLDPRRVTMHNLFRRLGQKEDPWADTPAPRSTIAQALESLQR
ncbi:MAG: non-homologous end-joining DNA ligase [Microthrixaceae bacterium]